MDRISLISKSLTSNSIKSKKSRDTVLQEVLEKIKILFPHLIIPTWVLSPVICGYLMKIGSFETRLNLVLVLIYQFFFIRKSKILRNILCKMKASEYFKDYKLILEDDLELSKSKTLFTFHPHGYFATGLYLAHLNNPVLKNNEIIGSRMALYYPWGGIIMKFLGVEGSNPENFELLMKENKNLSLIPGGFEESTLTQYGKQRLYLKNRKGFIKLALKHGYNIHPVYTFGETNMMNSLSNEYLGLILNKIKFPGTIPYSKNIILPNNKEELLTVIGKRIIMPKIENPSQKDIDNYHDIYVKNLKDLYIKNKRKCDGDLEIL